MRNPERRSPVGESDTFETCSEYGLYLKALDWCIENFRPVGGVIPVRWTIPDAIVTSWNERRTANRLVANGIWGHDDYENCYLFLYCYKTNTPAAILVRRRQAAKRTQKWRQSKAPDSTVQTVDVTRHVTRHIDNLQRPSGGRHVQSKSS